MAERTTRPQAAGAATRSGLLTRPLRWAVAAVTALAAAIALTVATWPASAAGNPYQRGPDPTLASVAASRGTFATAQVSVPPGNGFNGGTIYYPTDTTQGTWGAVAIVPGYTALFANEEAWMGPWLASFGFVVIGIETNSRNDFDTARGTQLLAALDYLTQKSPVRDRVDSARLGVIGHSMGGGGVVYATEHRPSLKAAVALAPFSPSQDMSTDHVPTMVMAGQNDTVVTPSYLDGLYATMPASAQSDFVQLAGADHVAYTHPNTTEMRLLIPWLKIFLDDDTRYTQFLCPLKDSTGVSMYRAKCPYVPPGGPTTSPTPTTTPTPPDGGACSATYRTVNSWSGGYQGEITVTAGGAAIDGWTVRWSLGGGQTVTQVWNGTLSTSGSTASVANASYNGSLQASASTTFGFLANGTPSTPALTCSSP
ncbi:cellulose binding domain-containing protein [Actinoallomurus spadix]|uniref:poly(ethylene terephthalate) hydrolase family protein n=1 Tax=Actinoallomurus spadix TaxID=79912 RepID=UPI002092BFD4|nr:cellulose binding domain-containing protein [Actinoallomurus spadix]MCO5991643.1 cellulose binding domain-containing protein [Actinoallomurus spadix]